MSIVESTKTKIERRIPRLEGIASGVLIAAALFAAAPKVVHAEVDMNTTGGTTTNPNATGAVSWFNTQNWTNASDSPQITGTLPESYITAAPPINLDPNNASMPSVGVVFDPADDTNTPPGTPGGNANYVANVTNQYGSFYISSDTGTTIAPSKLTVESGTIITGTTTVGRDAPGILAINGGSFILSNPNLGVGIALKVEGSNKTTIIGSGTLEYHGGYLEATGGVQLGSGAHPTGVGATSAGVGAFVVYNDGADGAILSANGFQFATNTAGTGTMGIVEFHYDLNPGLKSNGTLISSTLGGTRPIQTNWQSTNGTDSPGEFGILHIQNGTNLSSRLNLVLDTAPGSVTLPTDPTAYYSNLGLFDDTVISGASTYPKAFYSVDGTTVFTQGATISAVFGGSTYSWTISYSGQINFTNTATSAYNQTGIQATGGNDVVLIGITPLTNTPEPTGLAMLGGVGSLIMARRRNRKSNQAGDA